MGLFPLCSSARGVPTGTSLPTCVPCIASSFMRGGWTAGSGLSGRPPLAAVVEAGGEAVDVLVTEDAVLVAALALDNGVEVFEAASVAAGAPTDVGA